MILTNLKKHLKKYIFAYIAILSCFLFCATGYCDTGTDMLANTVKPDVEATFGPGSTFAWLVYVGEAVACMVLFHKSPSPTIFIRIIILTLGTAAMFHIIGS